MLERLRFDTVTAIRALIATPIPVFAAIVTLAVAVGLNLAMVALIDRALLSAPPHIVSPERVMTLSFRKNADDVQGGGMTTTSYMAFRSLRDDVPAFAQTAAYQRAAASVTIGGEQLRADTMMVTGAYFELLGARALVGRTVQASDDRDGPGAPIAIVSHAFWRSAFGGDRNVIGQPLSIRGLDYTVAGVMPEGFSGHSTTRVDLWVPLSSAMRNTPGWERDAFRNTISVLAKLAPDANVSAAETQAGAAIDRRVTLSPILGTEANSNERRIAWWLGGVSVLVLIVGLANAGTLLIVRATRRRQELGIRASLGATQARLFAQGWIEAIVLAGCATGVSLVAASWLDEAVRRGLFPALIERQGLGRTTMVTTALAALLTSLVAGVANTWNMPALARHGRGSALAGQRRGRSMTALLILQTAMSVLLLAGAGMFGTSFYRLAAQDFGMRMDDVVIVEAEIGPGAGRGPGHLYAEALDRVRALPGVEMATVIDAMPFGGFHVPPIGIPGRTEPPRIGRQLPFLLAVTPEWLKILEIEIIEGRTITEADERGPLVVLVNETMARTVWPGESAIGKCIRAGHDPDFVPGVSEPSDVPSDRVPCREVVGVVRDVRQRSVLPTGNEEHLMQYFVPFTQVPPPPFAGEQIQPRGLLLRVSTSAEALAPTIRKLIVGDRTDLAYVRVRPYRELLERQMRPWRLGATLFVLVSSLALGVAAVGLYAAFAHAVSERRREMAIRMAVGAAPRGVVRLVLRESFGIAAIGIVCGLAATLAAGRWVQSLLFETQPSDPLVLAAAGAVMLAVAAAATLAPARAAARNDPSALLRTE